MNWSIVIGALVVAITALVIYFVMKNKGKNNGDLTEVQKSKQEQGRIILYTSVSILTLFLIIGTLINLLNHNNFLKNLSATIIICWFVILVAYYAWAIYFYNINLGWSDDKWNRHRLKQEADPTGTSPAPNENPNGDETLGLPPGTVRGTLALTLLIVAVALVVGSLNEESVIKTNSVLADHFDFIKNAFLMMIAFYFGTKGIEALKNDTAQPPVQNVPDQQSATPAASTTQVDTKLTDDEHRAVENNFKLPGSQG